jgi:muramoyltetrapeptide carboxypeptidase LdcA involved in peptidoglycan recycling
MHEVAGSSPAGSIARGPSSFDAVPPRFTYPRKPQPGDHVAVLSPSGRAAAHFPAPYELGLTRLRDELGLVAVEYPTTRAAEASPEQRAADVHAAFADPDIAAVIASIGGEDQLKVLAHLDAEVLAASPKPFFGYSDNTNLHLFLWNLGVVSYHGGAVMVQLGRPGSLHPATRQSLERALFTSDTYELEPPAVYSDEEADWADQANLEAELSLSPAEPWSWHGPPTRVTGPAWGGSLEILDFQLRTGRYLLPDDAYDGSVLFLETSEELPPAPYVYRVLMNMGERRLLQRFLAVLWGRPKAWSFEEPNDAAQKARYTEEQREAVLSALAEYHPGAPIVFGVDFGHTDPQLVIPSGGDVTVDAGARRLEVTY